MPAWETMLGTMCGAQLSRARVSTQLSGHPRKRPRHTVTDYLGFPDMYRARPSANRLAGQCAAGAGTARHAAPRRRRRRRARTRAHARGCAGS